MSIDETDLPLLAKAGGHKNMAKVFIGGGHWVIIKDTDKTWTYQDSFINNDFVDMLECDQRVEHASAKRPEGYVLIKEYRWPDPNGLRWNVKRQYADAEQCVFGFNSKPYPRT